MKRTISKIIFFLISFGILQQAKASYECNVKVSHVLVYANGLVNVLHSGRNDFTVVCSLNVERKGVTPTTCAIWFALLESVKKRNGVANFYYGGEGSCATLPTYDESPAPGHIGDMQY